MLYSHVLCETTALKLTKKEVLYFIHCGKDLTLNLLYEIHISRIIVLYLRSEPLVGFLTVVVLRIEGRYKSTLRNILCIVLALISSCLEKGADI